MQARTITYYHDSPSRHHIKAQKIKILRKLTAVENNLFHASLLAKLVYYRPRLVNRMSGQVNRRGNGATLIIRPAHVDKKEAPFDVGAAEGLRFEVCEDGGSGDGADFGFGLAEGRPPGGFFFLGGSHSRWKCM